MDLNPHVNKIPYIGPLVLVQLCVCVCVHRLPSQMGSTLLMQLLVQLFGSKLTFLKVWLFLSYKLFARLRCSKKC